MLDVGFFELLLIAMIALLVIGPKRLPKVARTAGAYLGKAQRLFATVKSQVDQELAVSELKETLEAQARAIENSTTDIIQETRDETEFLTTTVPGAQGAFKNSLTETTATDPQTNPDTAGRDTNHTQDPPPSPPPRTTSGAARRSTTRSSATSRPSCVSSCATASKYRPSRFSFCRWRSSSVSTSPSA